MIDRYMPRAISLALAAFVTFSMLSGIDALALTEHAANDLMARMATAWSCA